MGCRLTWESHSGSDFADVLELKELMQVIARDAARAISDTNAPDVNIGLRDLSLSDRARGRGVRPVCH